MKIDGPPIPNNAAVERILDGTFSGVMTVCRGDRPYAVPLNHAYRDGRFYFHCAPSGTLQDHIRANPNCCYVIYRQYGDPTQHRKSARCHGNWESVVVYGQARVIEEREELRDCFVNFMAYFGFPNYRPTEKAFVETRGIIMDVQRMTSRCEKEGMKTEYWLWEPPKAR